MQKAQNKIKNAVFLYKQTFPEEFKLFCKGMEMTRRLQRDELASVKESQAISRMIHQVPEKLEQLFITNLDVEELEYYKTKEGARWFAKTFPEFRVPDKI